MKIFVRPDFFAFNYLFIFDLYFTFLYNLLEKNFGFFINFIGFFPIDFFDLNYNFPSIRLNLLTTEFLNIILQKWKQILLL